MLNGALLGILEEAATAVLTMCEGLEEEEFFASRLTQKEVLRQLRIMSDTVGNMPAETRTCLAEIDWEGWSALGVELRKETASGREQLWFAIRSLVPATLLWLRVYRKNQPEMFSFIP